MVPKHRQADTSKKADNGKKPGNDKAESGKNDLKNEAVAATRLTMFKEGFWLSRPRSQGNIYFVLKRLADISLSFFALVLLSPVLLITALAIRIESKGPIIFKQIRSGRYNQPFIMYKFRSMKIDSEKMRGSLLALNEMDGPVFKIREDPRITKIGKFIRRWSLDELPQLLNVIKGDMSIVGPRPLPVEEVALLDDRQLARQSVKPGLTCIWQISGRNEIPFEEWIQLDLIYIANRSILLDIEIFLRTFGAVLMRKGSS